MRTAVTARRRVHRPAILMPQASSCRARYSAHAAASSFCTAPHPHVTGPAARQGRRGIKRELFLPNEDGALACFPWEQLITAAEDAQRRFGNINSEAYEGLNGHDFGYETIVREHGIKSLGEDAVREAHDKGAVLLSPPSAEMQSRLLQGMVERPAPGFPWESAQSADSVADFFFTLVPVVFGRRLYMSHSRDYKNNLTNIMPAPPIPPLLLAIPPRALALAARLLPEWMLSQTGLTPRVIRAFAVR